MVCDIDKGCKTRFQIHPSHRVEQNETNSISSHMYFIGILKLDICTELSRHAENFQLALIAHEYGLF